jgi:hypothetical protein
MNDVVAARDPRDLEPLWLNLPTIIHAMRLRPKFYQSTSQG